MKLKAVISVVLVLAVLFGMSAALASGTKTNPLISKSYLEGTYRKSLDTLTKDTIKKQEKTLNSRIDALAGYDYSSYRLVPGFTKTDLGYLSKITLTPGASFMLASGSASVAYSKGRVINVTDGVVVKSGSLLEANKRYFCGENTTATITASGTGNGYADGYYRNEPKKATIFAERLFSYALGRNYDENALRSLVDQLVSGKLTAGSAAYGFVFSVETNNRKLSNEDFVDMLFGALLGRTPDSSEKSAWVDRLRAGQNRHTVFDSFIASPEFVNLCKDYAIKR